MLTRLFFFILITCILLLCGCQEPDNVNDSDSINVTITVTLLPEEITYNKSTTPDNSVEYKWSIIFDLDDSGTKTEGDFVMCITHWKQPGAMETTGSILDFDALLFQYISESSSVSRTNINRSVTENTITMQIDKSSYSGLEYITSNTYVLFDTLYYDDTHGFQIHDYYPANNTFTAIPDIGMFTDAAGDVSAQIIDMIEMTVFID